MASASTPYPNPAALSTSPISHHHHPSPTPSSSSSPSPPASSASSSPLTASPTSSTSTSLTPSQDSRKRKRNESVAISELPSAPISHSSFTERNVNQSGSMFAIQVLSDAWATLKSLVGISEPTAQPEEAPETPTKRVCVDSSLEEEGPISDDQPNKEESIATQISNKEALRLQTSNSRTVLTIRAPTSMGRQTPPTQQLPSPLASSSEDEGEGPFKKSTTTKSIRPVPPKMAPAQISSINSGPLEQNERPFFAEPIHKKRDTRVTLQRALARREAHGDLEMNYVPLAPRFPIHLQQNATYRNMMTPLPRSKSTREWNLTIGSPHEVWGVRTPETIRKTARKIGVLGHLIERAKQPPVNNGGIHKRVRENYARSQARSQAENESLEALLKQLIAEKAEGFHSYEEVAKRRQERAKDVQRMREADTKVDKIPPLTPEQVKLVRKTIAEVERDSKLGLNRRYVEKFKIPISTPDLLRMRPETWLNDEVINFYLNMIVARSLKEHPGEPQKILAHNTFFFPKLEAGGHKAVARWAWRLGVSDLLKLEYMFVPVHVAKTHWCLAVANFKLKRFEYYDSLGGNFTPRGRSAYYIVIRKYVEQETGTSCADWTDYSMKGAPQQSNNSDCGVFTIKTAETIARGGKMSFSANDMPLIRQRAMVEVLRGELLPWVADD